ncbi:MAG: PH domain-containing protein, partial [Muribaculaceae bacterium]|nr:PH domain-containing protein [Muribaculaceae bacterium]
GLMNSLIIVRLILWHHPTHKIKYEFEHLDEKYKKVQVIGISLTYIVLMGLCLLLLLADSIWWCISFEIALAIALAINLSIVSKAYQIKGYALREYDITYRSGFIFTKITTIPYSRLQQVTIKQNPISKFCRLYTVEIVNGAQGLSSLNIPGLPESTAKQIKNLLTEKLQQEND